MRRLFVKATGIGHGKIQEACFTHGVKLFGLDGSQWHRATETLEFVHLLLGQSSLETVRANGAACSGTILARISSQKTVVNNFCLTSPLLLPSTP